MARAWSVGAGAAPEREYRTPTTVQEALGASGMSAAGIHPSDQRLLAMAKAAEAKADAPAPEAPKPDDTTPPARETVTADRAAREADKPASSKPAESSKPESSKPESSKPASSKPSKPATVTADRAAREADTAAAESRPERVPVGPSPETLAKLPDQDREAIRTAARNKAAGKDSETASSGSSGNSSSAGPASSAGSADVAGERDATPASERTAEIADSIGISPDDLASDRETSTVTVNRGENLTGIASRFGLSVEDLLEHNEISDPDLIEDGQKLEVPAWAEAPSAETAVSERARELREEAERSEQALETVALAQMGLAHEAEQARRDAEDRRREAEQLEIANKVVEDLLARGAVETAERMASEIVSGTVRFVDESALGLDGASAVYDAAQGTALVPIQSLTRAIETSELTGTTDNRLMADLVDTVIHELTHADQHADAAGTAERDAAVSAAVEQAHASVERLGSMPLPAEDVAMAAEQAVHGVVSVYNGVYEVEAYQEGERARFEAGYLAPLSGWLTLAEDGTKLPFDEAHARVDAHVGSNPVLVQSLGANLMSGGGVDEDARWRRPTEENPAGDNPRWRRPTEDNPRWRRPTEANPAMENPRWRRPTSGNA